MREVEPTKVKLFLNLFPAPVQRDHDRSIGIVVTEQTVPSPRSDNPWAKTRFAFAGNI